MLPAYDVLFLSVSNMQALSCKGLAGLGVLLHIRIIETLIWYNITIYLIYGTTLKNTYVFMMFILCLFSIYPLKFIKLCLNNEKNTYHIFYYSVTGIFTVA